MSALRQAAPLARVPTGRRLQVTFLGVTLRHIRFGTSTAHGLSFQSQPKGESCVRFSALGFRVSEVAYARVTTIARAPRRRATVEPLGRTRLAHRAYARGAYSTLPNGQSDASQSLTARQRGTSSSAWLARTQESARASSSLSGSA
jgi:hypothetical protein